MAHFTTRQMKQLLEIDTAGPGIRAEVQELITRLTSGGVGVKTDDPREVQVKRLWDKGFGRVLKMVSFDEYLSTIPEIPAALIAPDDRFPELTLVDARLGIVKMCEILDIDYVTHGGTDETFEDFDPKHARTEKVYWVRLQDGKKNRNKSVRTCRSEFAKGEIGLTVHEALAFFAKYPEGFRNFGLDITDSVLRGNRDRAAYLRWFDARPRLYWSLVAYEYPFYGSGSRWE